MVLLGIYMNIVLLNCFSKVFSTLVVVVCRALLGLLLNAGLGLMDYELRHSQIDFELKFRWSQHISKCISNIR